ncbi:MAG: hypothetical protein KBS81_07100, partial [Spirochaetales bacterium]|nr:hypothetical protein [Candidatus Physcosoma equi]
KYKPPMTRDLSEREIINHVFECQNALNMGEISAGFKNDPAQFSEVLNIYINSTTRQAYEGIKAFVRADEWVASGCGPIASSSSIYGVIVESIEETGENTFVAHTTWYTPYAYEDEELDTSPLPENTTRCYMYSVDETFVFEWNKRGWWESTKTEIVDYKLLGTKVVETYAVGPNTAITSMNPSSSYF